MATTTDPHGGKPGTDLYGRGELDAKTDTGPGHGHAVQHGVETGDFDREISVSRILWSGVWLTVGTLVTVVLMWWFLRGFQIYDEHHEVRMMPMMARNPQTPPPAPRLQIDPTIDMVAMRAQEDLDVDHAGWVDQQGGTLRVPVDVAIDAIVQRGIAPFPGTTTATQAPAQARVQNEQGNPADNRKPGATVQNTQAPAATAAKPAKPPAATRPPGR
jgi:hypothetical protein